MIHFKVDEFSHQLNIDPLARVIFQFSELKKRSDR